MEGNPQSGNSGRNIGIAIAVGAVVLIVGVLFISKAYKHTTAPTISSTTSTANSVTPTASFTPTPTLGDTSNQQLDKDLQDAQTNLNKLDTSLSNTDQSLNNTSADNPTQ